MNIPCKDCIILALCLAKVKNCEFKYSELVRTCCLLKNYIEGDKKEDPHHKYRALQFAHIFYENVI